MSWNSKPPRRSSSATAIAHARANAAANAPSVARSRPFREPCPVSRNAARPSSVALMLGTTPSGPFFRSALARPACVSGSPGASVTAVANTCSAESRSPAWSLAAPRATKARPTLPRLSTLRSMRARRMLRSAAATASGLPVLSAATYSDQSASKDGAVGPAGAGVGTEAGAAWGAARSSASARGVITISPRASARRTPCAARKAAPRRARLPPPSDGLRSCPSASPGSR